MKYHLYNKCKVIPQVTISQIEEPTLYTGFRFQVALFTLFLTHLRVNSCKLL